MGTPIKFALPLVQQLVIRVARTDHEVFMAIVRGVAIDVVNALTPTQEAP